MGFLELRQARGVYSRVTTGMPVLNGSLFSEDGLVGSSCSPRDSQESSPTPQFKSISLVLSFRYSPTFISVHDMLYSYM